MKHAQVYLTFQSFVILHFIDIAVFIEISWQPCIEATGTIYTTALAHFMSLCHTLVILRICPTFSLLLYINDGDRVINNF